MLNSTQRLGLLLATLLSIELLSDREWSIHDNNSILSVSYEDQRKFVLVSILVALPSSLSECLEISNLLQLSDDPANTNQRPQELTGGLSFARLDQSLANKLADSSLLLASIVWVSLFAKSLVSHSVRFYPLVSLTYSALCMSHHLRSIHGQIRSLQATSSTAIGRKSAPIEECLDAETALGAAEAQIGQERAKLDAGQQTLSLGSLSGLNGSRSPDSDKPEAIAERTEQTVASIGLVRSNTRPEAGLAGKSSYRLSASSIRGFASATLARRSKTARPEAETETETKHRNTQHVSNSNSSSSSKLESNSNSFASLNSSSGGQLDRFGSRSSIVPAASSWDSGDQLALQSRFHNTPNGAEPNWCPRIHIGDIHELEQHLTKLSLLTGDIDRSSAAFAFAMISLSLFQLFYSLFLLVKFWSTSGWLVLRSALECASRVVSPFVLFWVSDSMEREASALVATLEVMYLQNSTKGLIQKNYGATMSSLMRVFRVLRNIRYSCDNFLGINLGTMKRLIFYSLTIMFIVVQYGK